MLAAMRRPAEVPGLLSLQANDLFFKRAMNICGFGVIVAVGFWWFGRPMPGVPPSVDLSFEIEMARVIPPIALGVSLVSLLLAAVRYLRVRKVFTEGVVVRGVVEELKTDTWQTSANMDQSYRKKTSTQRSYYATIRYAVRGPEQKVRLKLPSAGFTFGLQKDGEVELMVLESQPEKPLIRAVYLGK
jgi:hypothetical protein